MENLNSLRQVPSPLDEVETILHFLQSFYEAANFGTSDDLMTEYRKIARASGDQALYFANMLMDAETELREAPRENFVPSSGLEIQLMIVYAALAHCAEAVRPELNRDQRWRSVCWAHNHLGRLCGSLSGEFVGGMSSVIARAKSGAAARHRENRDMKQEVFEWLSKNMDRFTSLDGAAEAIAGDVVPIKFRTAREWVGQWKKTQPIPKKS